MVALVIRKAAPEDALGIAEVQVAAWHAAYRGLVPDVRLDAFTVEARHAAWTRILSDPNDRARTTVFVRDGVVVGFASVGPSRDADGSGEVWALYVHPGAWGSGAGRALLEEGLAHLSELGFASAMLWVLEGNTRAIRFYEAAGFHLDGATKVDGNLPHLRMER
jgi:ribosomal protein S18 acetylase RimI-like enzyme